MWSIEIEDENGLETFVITDAEGETLGRHGSEDSALEQLASLVKTEEMSVEDWEALMASR